MDLTGEDGIRIGSWHHFAAEVVGRVCHFYVGDDPEPKVTFDLFEFEHGRTGFEEPYPRWDFSVSGT